MKGPDVVWYLAIAAFLFCTGALGVLMRRSPLIILLSLEIMLNGANLALIAFARQQGNLDGRGHFEKGFKDQRPDQKAPSQRDALPERWHSNRKVKAVRASPARNQLQFLNVESRNEESTPWRSPDLEKTSTVAQLAWPAAKSIYLGPPK